ncbi:Copia protein, partial [Mucuna pruriens]
MAQGICEGLWMKIILDDLKVKYEGPIKLFCDNNSSISIAHNPVKHDRTKHIEIERHLIKEKLDSGLIVTTHVPIVLQVTDVFTKGFPATRFQELNGKRIVLRTQPTWHKNMSATIQDLKTQIGQLANIVSHLQSVWFGNLPSQTIPNPRGNASALTLRSGKELPQMTLQQESRPTNTNSKLNADSQAPQQEKFFPFPFPTRTSTTRRPEIDEELLRMF